MRPVTAFQPSPTASPVVTPLAANFTPAPVSVPATMAPAATPEPTATVRYAQGQLTVTSQNASLGTVLKLISTKTGATIDLAPELQNEPVAAQIGPNAVKDVMSVLLDSPKIDYIIMGSGTADGGLQRILSARGNRLDELSSPPAGHSSLRHRRRQERLNSSSMKMFLQWLGWPSHKRR